MTVTFVGAGPGDPELLTRKAERLLRRCGACIYAGSLVNPQVLELLPEACRRHDSARLDLEETTALLRDYHREGVAVVRLHSGEPSLYGAIGEQMARLDDLGIPYEVVPGISAFQAAAAALGCELTAPEVAQTVILTRTAGRTPLPESQRLANLAPARATLCIYLSTQNVEHVVETLRPHYGADCPAAVVYHASWPDQQVLRGTLADLAARVAEAGLTRTALIVVGHALAGPGTASRLYDSSFTTGYRQGRGES
jgi:precorrin-4/cobalt-precorrin-4 C11-methyltransferase